MERGDGIQSIITQSLQPLTPYLRQLDFIAVDVGPGRFTGIRTAVNFAKTLSYYFKDSCVPLPFSSYDC